MRTGQGARPRGRVRHACIAGVLVALAGLGGAFAAAPAPGESGRRPGVGPAGSMRLVYEVRPAEGESAQGVSERVLTILKRRVDPEGKLAWQLRGNRIEILIPLSDQSGKAHAAHEAYVQAGWALEQTNIRPGDVHRAITSLSGDTRKEILEKLADGSDKRRELFAGMTAAYDQAQKAEASQDAMKQAQAELQYEKLREKVAGTNVGAAQLEAALNAKAERQPAFLEALQRRAAGFPKQMEATDGFTKAYTAYREQRPLDTACEVKRLLRGSGVLSFHIVVQGEELTSDEAIEMRHRLKPDGAGVAPQAGDQMRWFCADRPADLGGAPMVEYGGEQWLLCWVTPERSMGRRPGEAPWALESAFPSTTDRGTLALGFRFDVPGAARFVELTGGNLRRMMAVALDGRIVSAATIQSVISRQGIISRESGYTDAEMRYMLSTLNAGALPAAISEGPISEEIIGPGPAK